MGHLLILTSPASAAARASPGAASTGPGRAWAGVMW